jgi:predicted acylesterase/phospholipase RssA
MARLGLALSGGGFRAAAFHLGVLGALRAAGRLEEVAVVSAVSGGALLAAAWVATGRDDFDAFEARMRGFLSSDLKKRVAVAALRPDRLLRLLLDPGYSLTEVLADVLDRQVLRGATLGALEGVQPRLVLSATCINHGTGWRFAPDRIGDWLLATESREKLDGFRLARAVAASAAFPGGFAPLVLRGGDLFGGARAPREVLLTDGGVDDNLGVQALVASGCDALVVSDGSSPFVPDARPLDRFGLPPLRRALLGLVLAGLVAWGALRLDLPAWGLAGLAVALVAVALRLRLALTLFATVVMRGQRRGLLRRLFVQARERPIVYIGLASALSAETERRLHASGLDLDRLRRARTDLALSKEEVAGLVALGEAAARDRLGAVCCRRAPEPSEPY